MLVEGTSLTVNQWDKKLRDIGDWILCSSDDGHHWLGIRKGQSGTTIRSCRTNVGDLLMLCAHFRVDFMGGHFNSSSYRYYKTGSQQVAGSLQDLSLAIVLRNFDEGINAQNQNGYESQTEYQFRSDIYMAYLNEAIEEHRSKRDDIMSEITDAASASTKIPRLQQELQEFDENFDVINLINFKPVRQQGIAYL